MDAWPAKAGASRPTEMPSNHAPAMRHLHRLTVFVDEPDPGQFYWVLIQGTEDAGHWEDVEASEQSFTTWTAAFEAGCVALYKRVRDERIGPRTAGENQPQRASA
jgi:hypothetical protein